MRLPCPHCGTRGLMEFSYFGAAGPVRPAAGAGAEAWHDYAHVRENVAGPHRELWQHAHGCRRWLVVTRDTRTHAVLAAEDAGRRGA
jgi:sarcosine oxidase subunit delta